MANKFDEESDYLQSLFLKPFCQKMQSQVIPSKLKNSKSNRNQYNKKIQVYNPYSFILSEDSQSYISKIHNQNNNKNISNRPHDKVTPYQSRKNQQKMLSKQLKDNINVGQIPNILQSSQDSWLIIKEIQTKLKQTNIHKNKLNKQHKHDLSTLQISQKSTPYHRKKYSQSQIKKSTKTQFSTQNDKQQSKNIKSMLSYYKNKRAIKQMNKINDGPFNLTNTQIQQSVNLRVQTMPSSKNSQKIQELIKKIKRSYNNHRKASMEDKHKKDAINISSDKIKIRLNKSVNFNPFIIKSQKLDGILNSFKIDMVKKQKRPRTQTRMNKPQCSSHSKKSTQYQQINDLTGWQSFFQKTQNQSICLI